MRRQTSFTPQLLFAKYINNAYCYIKYIIGILGYLALKQSQSRLISESLLNCIIHVATYKLAVLKSCIKLADHELRRQDPNVCAVSIRL